MTQLNRLKNLKVSDIFRSLAVHGPALFVIFSVLVYLLCSHKPFGAYLDYVFFVPHLMSNRLYFLNNGFFHLPYYTPAFCGGTCQYADVQDLTFSLIQFIVDMNSNIYTALRLSFVASTFLSYIGMFLFLRRLGLQKIVSVGAAVVYAFNGFLVYRWLVGHLTFHTMWTIPFILWKTPDLIENRSIRSFITALVSIALLGSINLFSSGIYPYYVAIILIATYTVAWAFCTKKIPWMAVLGFVLAGFLSVILTSSKIFAVINLLKQFPHEMPNDCYSAGQVIRIIFFGLFDPRRRMTVNTSIGMWGEFNSYVGITLFLGLVIGIRFYWRHRQEQQNLPALKLSALWFLLTIFCAGYLMLGSNLFWSAVKNWPVLKSNHGAYRIIGALPFVTVVFWATLLESMWTTSPVRRWLAVLLLFLPVIDVLSYAARSGIEGMFFVTYDYPAEMKEVQIHSWDKRNRLGGVTHPNPLFGYSSENLKPPIDLDQSPLTIFPDGTYNVNDPVAMAYGHLIGKSAWTRLPSTVSEGQVKRFLSFKDPEFYVPPQQTMANYVSLLFWMASVVYLLLRCLIL